jgi:hypothetical protein
MGYVGSVIGEKQTLKSVSALPILTYCSFVSHPQLKHVYRDVLDFQNSILEYENVNE